MSAGQACGLPLLLSRGAAVVSGVKGGAQRPRSQCRVVKPGRPESTALVAYGLRSGIGRGASRGRERVPAGAGLGKKAQAGPFGELGEHVTGLDAEQVSEVASGPVASGLAGHEAGDLVSSGVGPGLAGTGRLALAAAGTGGGPVRWRGHDGDLYPGDPGGQFGPVLVADAPPGGGAFHFPGAVACPPGGQQAVPGRRGRSGRCRRGLRVDAARGDDLLPRGFERDGEAGPVRVGARDGPGGGRSWPCAAPGRRSAGPIVPARRRAGRRSGARTRRAGCAAARGRRPRSRRVAAARCRAAAP